MLLHTHIFLIVARPERPTLTLSYEFIEGQVPNADRLSECKAQIGDPAGKLVVEVFTDGDFQEEEVTYGTGFPKNRSLECGTEQTMQFYFNNLTGLNNTEIRCAVIPAEVFNDTGKVLSEPQLLQTIDGKFKTNVKNIYLSTKTFITVTRNTNVSSLKCFML